MSGGRETQLLSRAAIGLITVPVIQSCARAGLCLFSDFSAAIVAVVDRVHVFIAVLPLIMIILAPEDQPQVKNDPHASRPTVRLPEPAVPAGRSSTPSTLPDYETSQAQQLLEHHFPSRRRRGWHWPQASLNLKPRSYKALLYGLALYVFLTIVVGVPSSSQYVFCCISATQNSPWGIAIAKTLSSSPPAPLG